MTPDDYAESFCLYNFEGNPHYNDYVDDSKEEYMKTARVPTTK